MTYTDYDRISCEQFLEDTDVTYFIKIVHATALSTFICKNTTFVHKQQVIKAKTNTILTQIADI